MSRNPVPAFAGRRGPDGTDGGAAVCPGQVMMQGKRSTLKFKSFQYNHLPSSAFIHQA